MAELEKRPVAPDLKAFLDEGIRGLAADAVRLVARRPRLAAEMKRMKDALMAQEAKRQASLRRGADVPPFIIASITKRCNLGCAGCYAAVNQCGCAKELKEDRWSAFFGEAEKLGVSFILLAGGEPLERMDVIGRAPETRSIVFPIFTNGCGIDEGVAGFFAAHRNLIPLISLEGGKERTDGRRSPGVFDEVMRAMDLLKSKAVFFGTSLTVTRENIKEACSDEFIGMLRRKGASVFIYVEYVPADGVSEDLAPGPAERQLLEARTRELKRSAGGIHICFPGDEDAMGGCLAAGRGFVHVNPSGGIEPCPFSPESDRSISEFSLEEALKSPFLAAVRDSGAMELKHLGGCALWNRRDQVAEILRESGS